MMVEGVDMLIDVGDANDMSTGILIDIFAKAKARASGKSISRYQQL